MHADNHLPIAQTGSRSALTGDALGFPAIYRLHLLAVNLLFSNLLGYLGSPRNRTHFKKLFKKEAYELSDHSGFSPTV